MGDNRDDVAAASFWHPLLDWLKVLPEVLDGLYWCARGMVGPESTRGGDFGPSSKRSRV